jgi:hypothetical protein
MAVEKVLDQPIPTPEPTLAEPTGKHVQNVALLHVMDQLPDCGK